MLNLAGALPRTLWLDTEQCLLNIVGALPPHPLCWLTNSVGTICYHHQKVSTRIHQKYVHENSPKVSTRIHPLKMSTRIRPFWKKGPQEVNLHEKSPSQLINHVIHLYSSVNSSKIEQMHGVVLTAEKHTERNRHR